MIRDEIHGARPHKKYKRGSDFDFHCRLPLYY